MNSQIKRIQRKLFIKRKRDERMRFNDDVTDKLIGSALGTLNKIAYDVAKAKLGLGNAKQAVQKQNPAGILGALAIAGTSFGLILKNAAEIRRIATEIRRWVFPIAKTAASSGRGPGRPPLNKPKPDIPKRPVGRPRKNPLPDQPK